MNVSPFTFILHLIYALFCTLLSFPITAYGWTGTVLELQDYRFRLQRLEAISVHATHSAHGRRDPSILANFLTFFSLSLIRMLCPPMVFMSNDRPFFDSYSAVGDLLFSVFVDFDCWMGVTKLVVHVLSPHSPLAQILALCNHTNS